MRSDGCGVKPCVSCHINNASFYAFCCGDSLLNLFQHFNYTLYITLLNIREIHILLTECTYIFVWLRENTAIDSLYFINFYNRTGVCLFVLVCVCVCVCVCVPRGSK
jgi:hypothetical protein